MMGQSAAQYKQVAAGQTPPAGPLAALGALFTRK
jgi:hypothetical protein